MGLRELSVLVVFGWFLVAGGCALGAYGVHVLTRGRAAGATSGARGAASAKWSGWSMFFAALILIIFGLGVVVSMPEAFLTFRIVLTGLCTGLAVAFAARARGARNSRERV
ncbi:hypothetical protein ACLQ2R_28145 [Streptosporangium sp. DT93]|uniref:hypothetical protein n=1 Tax=Streptosporangium sp. DT93 TaxID=3393428 RepID=UPI003CF26301